MERSSALKGGLVEEASGLLTTGPGWKSPVTDLYVKKSFDAEQNELCYDGELCLQSHERRSLPLTHLN